jgi:DNA-binding transcriptional MerR regulator
MTLLEWCKFMRALKEKSGITNREIEKQSGVSIKTIEKIMALNTDHDIMRDTARLIENAIIGSCTSYPCYLAFEENLPEVSQRVSNDLRDLERALDEQHREALDNIRNSHAAELLAIKAAHTAEINTIVDEYTGKIQYLLGLVERLQSDHDHLWKENTRKSHIIDRLIERQGVL